MTGSMIRKDIETWNLKETSLKWTCYKNTSKSIPERTLYILNEAKLWNTPWLSTVSLYPVGYHWDPTRVPSHRYLQWNHIYIYIHLRLCMWRNRIAIWANSWNHGTYNPWNPKSMLEGGVVQWMAMNKMLKMITCCLFLWFLVFHKT